MAMGCQEDCSEYPMLPISMGIVVVAFMISLIIAKLIDIFYDVYLWKYKKFSKNNGNDTFLNKQYEARTKRLIGMRFKTDLERMKTLLDNNKLAKFDEFEAMKRLTIIDNLITSKIYSSQNSPFAEEIEMKKKQQQEQQSFPNETKPSDDLRQVEDGKTANNKINKVHPTISEHNEKEEELKNKKKKKKKQRKESSSTETETETVSDSSSSSSDNNNNNKSKNNHKTKDRKEIKAEKKFKEDKSLENLENKLKNHEKKTQNNNKRKNSENLIKQKEKFDKEGKFKKYF
jgi:hypothetical protein